MPSRLFGAGFASIIFMATIHAQNPVPTMLKLPNIISDHMLLQAGQPDPLWGWAPAGTAVTAEFLDPSGNVLAQAAGTAAADGKWMLKLSPPASGTAGQLRFTAGAATKTVQDVLVGEAWLCGGQSNMTYDFGADNMEKTQVDAARQQAAKENGSIRIFHTDWAVAGTPQDDSPGSWYVVTPDRIGGGTFCVAWYFAVALREKVPQPVGLVECAIGGTRAEQWMSKTALQALPHGPEVIKQQDDNAAQQMPGIEAARAKHDAWLAANPTPELQNQNRAGEPPNPGPPTRYSDLYNGMLHGLEPYGLRGITWFQADGNLGATPIYGELIKGLITSWRADFQAHLPFYYVEMNNMRDWVQTQPVQFNELSQLREAQDAALELPGTDVACSIDCGLPEPEPHFPDKEPVGRRLAALALDHVYGMKQVCHSPTYASMAVESNTIRVKFTDSDGLRVRGGGQMKGFAIRGATGAWVWAQGKVDGNDVVLWSDKIPQPAAVRYAWAPNPVISMENGTGFPMRPFRTDKDSPQ
jgi:sialate O-acetylesterase